MMFCRSQSPTIASGANPVSASGSLLSLLLLGGACPPLWAATYFAAKAAPGTNDSITGSAASPWSNVGNGPAPARAGDVMIVTAGRYEEGINLTTYSSLPGTYTSASPRKGAGIFPKSSPKNQTHAFAQ